MVFHSWLFHNRGEIKSRYVLSSFKVGKRIYLKTKLEIRSKLQYKTQEKKRKKDGSSNDSTATAAAAAAVAAA